MKKFFLHTLVSFLVLVNGALAVDFPKTYTSYSCVNCTPAGYTIVTGGPVALSNMNGLGGSPTRPWLDGFLPPPSSTKAIDQNGNNIFLSLRYGNVQKDKLKANVGGFEIGNKYTLHYYVMTARVDLTTGNSDYAASATIEVQTTNFVSIASKTTTFSQGVNVSKWVEETLTFVAPATDLVFYLSGMSNPQQTAFVNFDIHPKSFDCVVPGGQVELFHGGSQSTPFACGTTNLYDLIKSTTPAGAVPVWGINPSSSYPQLTEQEAKTAGPKAAGQYYYAFYKTPGGCYNTDISTAKASFIATPTQVALTSNQKSIDCINQSGVDLNAQLSPTTYKVHWFTNDKHQGIPFDNPPSAPVNSYYAFYFDSKNNCYSVDKAASSALFSVYGSTMCCNDPSDPSNQVPLLNTDVKIVAPAQTYDLTKLIPSNISIPPNAIIEWYTTSDHSSAPISDPQHVSAGKYYAFVHDLSNGCFNVPLSKSSVNVSKACNAGSTPVALKTVNNLYCQEGEPPINLNDFVASVPPAGLSVVWYTNNQHSGNPVTTGQVGEVPYFAFFYDNANQCFSPPSSSLYFTTMQVTLNCPYEDGCQYSTSCPSGGVNLNALHSGPIPSGWEVRWFNNRFHTGQQIANPDNLTEEGDYYAFYYSPTKQCYNKTGFQQDGTEDLSNKKITIVNQPCGTQLDLRVVLQGARLSGTGDDIMRNDLQLYGNSGLLPTVSPYGDLETCPDINNSLKMSNVADWVKVEIRDATTPSTLLESRSLILLSSGFVADLDGSLPPVFTSQSKPVRIVVKHRNHLPVMSNPIQDFSTGTVSYDFTTALSQASNAFGDSPQMVQKNGTWCMPSADLNATQDFVIDGKDGTFFNTQFRTDVFDSYDRADLNMDGIVDGVDGTLFNINFYLDIFSTLINY
ncbi:hypothetical protein [Dyadobacter sp. 676]|uniref:Ig-like domain-containing protein n=1 Tax=Dyadobacter sp. 676 TaxID=3088362 RepID=A0AAU8FPA0_9BACT